MKFTILFLIIILSSGVFGYGLCSYYQPIYRLSSPKGADTVNYGKSTKYYSEVYWWYNDYLWAFPSDEIWIEEQPQRNAEWRKINQPLSCQKCNG